jgi:diacylglycerol O-acyltransferase 1
MLIQAPMMFLQGVLEKALNLERSQIGNLSFWLVFCFLGQPLLVFVYCYTYVQNTP